MNSRVLSLVIATFVLLGCVYPAQQTTSREQTPTPSDQNIYATDQKNGTQIIEDIRQTLSRFHFANVNATSDCKEIEENNSIYFYFYDHDNITKSINFRAWRYVKNSGPIPPVCNYTINASFGEWICKLPESENSTLYDYACVIDVET